MKLLWVLFVLSAFRMEGAVPEGMTIRIAKYKDDKVCAISYTFDDGLQEQYTLAVPQLEKYGFRGTFWINGAKINESDRMVKDSTRMSWPELRKMAEKGHEISSHSWSHKKLVKISVQEVAEEIEKNDSIILEKVGILPKTFCYPYNARNPEVVRLATKNRVGTRTRQFALGGRMSPEKLEEKLRQILETGDWGVAMTHGITYGYDAFGDPSIFWKHLEKVKALDDKIWVATFCEVMSYVKEQENTQLEITGKRKSLKVIPRSALEEELFAEPLTMVVEKKGIRKIRVRQDGKDVKVSLLPDKALFDFNPFGGAIQINWK